MLISIDEMRIAGIASLIAIGQRFTVKVSLARGQAWIETKRLGVFRRWISCRLLAGKRGLKHGDQMTKKPDGLGRLLAGKRGLKHFPELAGVSDLVVACSRASVD